MGMLAGGFYSQGNPDTLKLTDATSSATDFSEPLSSTCAHRINSNGDYEWEIVGSWSTGTHTDEWIDVFTGSSASDYECRMSSLSGSGGTTSGTFGTWQDCDTTRTWRLTLTGAGDITRTGTLEVREKANTSNSASCTATFDLFNEAV